MPDWLQIVNQSHADAHPDDGYKLVTQPGVGGDHIARIKEALGVTFPDEFRDLYTTLSGFGVAPDDAPTRFTGCFALWIICQISSDRCGRGYLQHIRTSRHAIFHSSTLQTATAADTSPR